MLLPVIVAMPLAALLSPIETLPPTASVPPVMTCSAPTPTSPIASSLPTLRSLGPDTVRTCMMPSSWVATATGPLTSNSAPPVTCAAPLPNAPTCSSFACIRVPVPVTIKLPDPPVWAPTVIAGVATPAPTVDVEPSWNSSSPLP